MRREILDLQGVQKITAFVFSRSRQALRFHLAPFRLRTFTQRLNGLKTARKRHNQPSRSHYAEAKLFENVTFPVTFWVRFLNGARWKRSAWRLRVNTNPVTFLCRLQTTHLRHRIKTHRRSTHPKKRNRCHVMICHQNADAMIPASALMRGIPWTSAILNIIRGVNALNYK
jgi:ATP-dependent helicase YprA (DUF1998 family)